MDSITPPANNTPAPAPSDNQEEELLAQWVEIEHPHNTMTPRQRLGVIIGGTVLVIGLSLLGYFLKTLSFYLGAVAALVGSISIFAQDKRKDPTLEIALTNHRLIVGRREYALADLAGFWIEKDGEYVIINFEMKKHTLIPISCFFASGNEDEARAALTVALPEVEPRVERLSESISKYFRF